MKHKKFSTRILAIILSITMVCIVLPMNAFADGDELEPPGTVENGESNLTNVIESVTPIDEALDAPMPTAINITTVGTTGADYTTIADALQNATNDSIIQLVTQIEESISIQNPKNVTIDLNGQTWTNAPAAQSVITVSSGAILTIKDSGDDGKILNAGTGASIINNGTCIIISGTIKGAKYGVQTMYPGVLTIKGGNILVGEATSSDSYAIWNRSSQVDIQGGFIEAFGTRARAIQNQVAPIIGMPNHVTISGGLLTVTGNGAMAIQIDKGSLDITGGSIHASAADSNTTVTVIDSQGLRAGSDTTVNIADEVTISPEGAIMPKTILYAESKSFGASVNAGKASFNLEGQYTYNDYSGMRWFIYTVPKELSNITASSNGKILTLNGVEMNKQYLAVAYDRSHGRGASDVFYDLRTIGIGATDPVFTYNLSTDEVTYGVNDTAATLNATATAADGGTITYEWYKKTKNSDPEGTKLNVSTPTYTPLTGSMGTTYYYCVATNTIEDNGDGGTKTATVTSKLAQITVDKAAAEKLVEAKKLAEDVIIKIVLTNETDLPKVLEEAIVNIPKVTVRWKQDPIIEPATRQSSGTMIGTILLTCDGETVEVSVNREIPLLPITVGSPGSGAEYTTVQEAIDAASDNDTIQLITAMTESVNTNTKSINFDLNGQKWTGTNDNTIIVENGGYVVILDSGKGGTIENAQNKDTAVIVTEGACFITGGTIKGKARGVDIKEGSFIVSGGTVVVGQDASQDIGAVAIYNEGGHVEVQSGTVEANGKNARAIINEKSINNQSAEAYISGGNITVTGDNSIVIFHNSGPLYVYEGNLIATPASPEGDCLIIKRTGTGVTSIQDEVTMNPEGKMMPLTVLNEKSLTSPITSGVASYQLEENYKDMKWFVYTTPTGKELASNITASSSGKTLTLQGVTSNTTYYVAAYDRSIGNGISSTRWTLKTTKPTNAAVPTLTKDLSTNEVIYNLRATATALNTNAIASDGGTITYEWYKNTKNSITEGTKLNVTTATYNPSTDHIGTIYYYCVVTNTINGEGGIKKSSVTTSIAKITVENKGSNNGGSSSGNSGSTTLEPTTPSTQPSPAVPSSNTGTMVIVGGKAENIGMESKTDTITTVMVNQDKFSESVGRTVAGSSVVVPVSQNGIATAQFVVKNVEEMAAKDMILTVQTGNVAYNLSTAAIDIVALAADFPGVDTTKIPFNVSIKNSSTHIKGETLVLPPVEFTITATYGERTINVETFNAYIDRVIEVTKEQAKKITTAVVANEDGSVRHVPTYIYEKNSKYYATINSRTNSTYALIYNDVTFADAVGKWYESAINEMGSRKIVTGYEKGRFAGEDRITRAEFATILVKALGLPVSGTSNFSDVPGSAWYNGAVATATKYGLISGVGNNDFAPLDNITRQEAMLMLQRAATLTEFAGANDNLDGFKDAKNISSWARNAAQWNVGSGLIQGSNGQINANENISRAESATIILRLLQKSKLVDIRSKA